MTKLTECFRPIIFFETVDLYFITNIITYKCLIKFYIYDTKEPVKIRDKVNVHLEAKKSGKANDNGLGLNTKG